MREPEHKQGGRHSRQERLGCQHARLEHTLPRPGHQLGLTQDFLQPVPSSSLIFGMLAGRESQAVHNRVARRSPAVGARPGPS